MASESKILAEILQQAEVNPVLPNLWLPRAVTVLDFSANNKHLAETDLTNTAAFAEFVRLQIAQAGAQIGAGGYAENRIIYNSAVFTAEEEPRTLHLGIDLWAPAGTPVMAPLPGVVHSFANNAAYRDYGPTIILEHELEGLIFYTLYGHLAGTSLQNLHKGQYIPAGTGFAAIGAEHENVQWPPHLHFQLITDMLGKEGDFYGVAPLSEKEFYLALCPDPNVILRVPALS